MNLTSDQATLILNAVSLPTLQSEYQITRRVIAAIPTPQAEYRPNEIVRTALDLAWHIVSAENRFVEAVINGTFDLTPATRPESMRSGDDVNRWYAERFDRNVARLKQLSGEHLTKPIDFRGLFQLPAVNFVLLAAQHSIHHRGQLSTYLRPMGAKVPSIYGESYDARLAREAAHQAV